MFGIYEAAKADYWKIIESGKVPGLKWKHKPGEPVGLDEN